MQNKKFKATLFMLTLLLGILFVMQYRSLSTGVKYMGMKDMYISSIELDAQQAEVDQLKIKKEELQAKIQTFEDAKSSRSSDFETVMEDEIESTRVLSGLTAVEGPGVVIIVSDGTRELNEYEDANVVLVHDIDIRSMVDDLRNAGAEAISINGQRVVFNKSKIQCVGPTIKINDQVFAPPYIIEAIGDRKYLESAINAPGSYSDSLRTWGIFVEVNTSISVSIPAYEGGMNYNYISEVE